MDHTFSPLNETALFCTDAIAQAILAFVKPHEEFLFATVCRSWRDILVARRSERDELTWATHLATVVNTIPRLQWALANGCVLREAVCTAAASGKHWEVLLWARMIGCPCDPTTCSSSAEKQHVEILEWARDKEGCWKPSTDATQEHLEVLKWARDSTNALNVWMCTDMSQKGPTWMCISGESERV
jgi:hypothetical protein